MDSRFKIPLLFFLVVILLTGCFSFRVMHARDGNDVADPGNRFQPGKSGLGEVLAAYGAPTEVHKLGTETLLIYERMHYRGGEITAGIPMSDILPTSVNLSGHGDLIRYDTAAFFFRQDSVLIRTAYVQGSSYPFWDTFWTDKTSRP